MNFALTEGKIQPKVTRARGSINSQLAKQLVLHQLHVSAVSKKKMGAKKAEESHVTRERLPRTRPDYSSSSDSSLSESSAFLKHRRGTCPLFVSVLWKYVLYLSLCVFVDHGLNVCAWNVTETLQLSPEALSFQLGKMSELFLDYMLK